MDPYIIYIKKEAFKNLFFPIWSLKWLNSDDPAAFRDIGQSVFLIFPSKF